MLVKNKIKYITSFLTIGAVSSSLSACAKSNNFEISWLDGTIINCIGEEYYNYHNISEIKNAIVQKVEIAPDLSISVLPQWDDSNLEKEKMYYDLVASLAFNSNFIPFYLDFSSTDGKITGRMINLIYKNKNKQILQNESIIGIPSYKVKNKIIYLYLNDHEITNSYKFINTKYKGE